MSKCRRNIILISGYLLIIAALFVPCKKINFGFDLKDTEVKKKRWQNKREIVFSPFFIGRLIKYEKYKKWESPNFLILTKKTKEKRELEENTKRKIELLKVRKGSTNKTLEEIAELIAREYNRQYEINTDIAEIKRELNEKFGNKPYYHKLRTELFISEIAVILLVAGLAYILFCLVLRKAKESTEK